MTIFILKYEDCKVRTNKSMDYYIWQPNIVLERRI